MKTSTILLSLVLVFQIFTACVSDEVGDLKQENEDLKERLKGYREDNQQKSESIVAFDNSIEKFGNIQDSIQLREFLVDSLQTEIRRKGRASRSDNEILNKLLDEINSFLKENTELAIGLDTTAFVNANSEKIVKLLLQSVADKQQQINSMKEELAILDKEVKGLRVKNAHLLRSSIELAEANIKLNKSARKLAIETISYSFPINMFNQVIKAKKIDNFEACYTVQENKFAGAGKKTLYVRIIMPNDQLLDATKEKLFTYNGSQIGYSMKQEIDYNNEALKSCLKWNKSTVPLVAGRYFAEYFLDGQQVGSRGFYLEH